MDMLNDTIERCWSVVAFESRIDSFNGHRYKKRLFDAVDSGRLNIAVDLSQTQFINLPTIKFLASTARVLAMKGGQLALIGISDKLERQLGIFSSTDDFLFCDTFKNLSGSIA